MVTWGSNTIHTVPQRAPAPTTTFGSPAPATGFGAPAASSGLFGSASPSNTFGGTPSPSGIFGSAPSSGSLFGSAPSSGTFGAPAPSGGLFGSAPAPSTSLFGSAPSSGSLFGSSPAPSGGLFGNTSNTSSAPFSFSSAAPSSGLFGAPSTPGFGQQQQQQQRPTVPQQAAQQALLDASARQEEYRVQSALEKLNHAYQGTEIATDTNSADFSVTLYHSVSPEIRQMQSLQGVGLDGKPLPIAPPRPPQISEEDWTRAVVCNTDHENYMPVALVGARALQARVQGQQQQANTCVQQLNDIQETAEVIRDRNHGANARLVEAEREQARLRKRMLAVMRKVEVLRCLSHPLQQGEVEAMHKLAEVEKQIYQNIQPALQRLAEIVRSNVSSQPPTVSIPNDLDELKVVLTKHREALSRMTTAVQHDKGDLELIQKRVQVKAPSSSSLF